MNPFSAVPYYVQVTGLAQAYLFLMQEGFGAGQTVVVDGGTVLV